MLRLRTKVTTSPTAWRRSSSATSATAATSGPRAAEQGDELLDAGLLAGRAPRPAPRRRPPARRAARDTAGRVERCSGRLGGSGVPPGGPARRSSGQALGVGAVQDREAEVRVEPALGVGGELGVDGEPRGQRRSPAASVTARSRSRAGQGALGVDVVGGDGRDPAPVVDAGVQQDAEVVGQVGRRLEVDVGGQQQPGDGDRPQVLVRAGRAAGGAWPCPAWAGSSGRSPPGRGRGGGGWPRWPRRASSRSARVSPMPTRIPVVNGMASSPAASRVASRRLGRLVGRAVVGRRARGAARERLQHHPLAGRRPGAGAPARPGAGRRRWRGAAGRSRRAPAGTRRAR